MGYFLIKISHAYKISTQNSMAHISRLSRSSCSLEQLCRFCDFFVCFVVCVCFFIFRFYMYVYMSMDFAQHRTPKLFEGMIKPALCYERFVRLGVYNERNRNRLGAGSNCCPINGKGCPNWIAQSVGWISVRICLFP